MVDSSSVLVVDVSPVDVDDSGVAPPLSVVVLFSAVRVVLSVMVDVSAVLVLDVSPVTVVDSAVDPISSTVDLISGVLVV